MIGEAISGPLFSVKIRVSDIEHVIGYSSIEQCLGDRALEKLFADGFVSECSIYSGAMRLTARQIGDWRSFREQVEQNQKTIERGNT